MTPAPTATPCPMSAVEAEYLAAGAAMDALRAGLLGAARVQLDLTEADDETVTTAVVAALEDRDTLAGVLVLEAAAVVVTMHGLALDGPCDLADLVREALG